MPNAPPDTTHPAGARQRPRRSPRRRRRRRSWPTGSRPPPRTGRSRRAGADPAPTARPASRPWCPAGSACSRSSHLGRPLVVAGDDEPQAEALAAGELALRRRPGARRSGDLAQVVRETDEPASRWSRSATPPTSVTEVVSHRSPGLAHQAQREPGQPLVVARPRVTRPASSSVATISGSPARSRSATSTSASPGCSTPAEVGHRPREPVHAHPAALAQPTAEQLVVDVLLGRAGSGASGRGAPRRGPGR